MKLLPFLIGVMLLIGCTPVAEESADGLEELGEESEEVPSPGIPSEEETETAQQERLVGSQSAIQQGVFVNLEGIFYDREQQRIYFEFSAEDKHEQPEVRDALRWKAILYFTRDEQLVLFLCDFMNQEEFWSASYCEEKRNIPQHWYGQKLWIIYTLQDPSAFREGKSILDVIREEDTFAFKIIIPKP